LLAISRDGHLDWAKVLHNPSWSDEKALRVCRAPNGDLLVAGTAVVGDQRDITLARLSSDGDVLWARTYDSGANRDESLGDLEIDSFGNLYLTGTAQRLLTQDIFTAKMDGQGRLIWTAVHHEAEDMAAGNDLIVGASGEVYVVGTTGRGWLQGQPLVLRYDEAR